MVNLPEMTTKSKKYVLVTGSTRGIGLAIAHYLQTQGCLVILNGLDRQRLLNASSQLDTPFYFQGDLSDFQTAKKLESYLTDHVGKLDYLVCNAGGGVSSSIDANSTSGWELLINKNLMTTVHTVDSCERLLSVSSSPSIVCISSICGSTVISDAPLGYSCSKAALNMYVRCKALQLAQKNKINAIEPNIIFEDSVWIDVLSQILLELIEF